MAKTSCYCIVHPRSEFYDSRFSFQDSRLLLGSGAEQQSFKFDRVLGPGTPQDTVYREVAKDAVVAAFAEEPSSTAFLAVGASGSGKTYAVTGGAQHFADRGLIPRSLTTVFEALSLQRDRSEREVSISFFEIYQGQLFDLLSTETEPANTSLAEGHRLPHCHPVSSENVAFKLLCDGDARRKFQNGAPESPDCSMSHVVFAIHVMRRGYRSACLAFIDLSAQSTAEENTFSAASSLAAIVTQTLPPPSHKLLQNTVLQQAFLEARAAKAPAHLTRLLQPWLDPGLLVGDSGKGWPDPGAGPCKLVLLQCVRYNSSCFLEIQTWLKVAALLLAALFGSQDSSLDRPAAGREVPEPAAEPGSEGLGLAHKPTANKTSLQREREPLKFETDATLEMVADMEISPFSWWAKLLHDLREESLRSPTAAEQKDKKERRMVAWAEGIAAAAAENDLSIKEKLNGAPPAVPPPLALDVKKEQREKADDAASLEAAIFKSASSSRDEKDKAAEATLPASATPGQMQTVPAVVRHAAQAPVLQMESVCQRCGAAFAPHANFCLNCGAKRGNVAASALPVQVQWPAGLTVMPASSHAASLAPRSLSPQPCASRTRIIAGPQLQKYTQGAYVADPRAVTSQPRAVTPQSGRSVSPQPMRAESWAPIAVVPGAPLRRSASQQGPMPQVAPQAPAPLPLQTPMAQPFQAARAPGPFQAPVGSQFLVPKGCLPADANAPVRGAAACVPPPFVQRPPPGPSSEVSLSEREERGPNLSGQQAFRPGFQVPLIR
eukprot:TRINITY_DN6020_c0_g1_i1.p1 TRINITY_DN6020_c0_g1~~TRINITY_DN6020_c0_g1_i1.p1  ORF type:complete len:777 (-),score=175.65 TRINITY_DN6020_c0_g1_i1:74-2404(-)